MARPHVSSGAPVPGWFEDSGDDLRAAGPPPTFGPFGLALLGLALAAGLGFLANHPAELAWDQGPDAPLDAAARWSQRIQAAIDEKAAGRYREAWKALRELHDERPREPQVNLELAHYHWEVGNLDFAEEYLRLVEEADADRPRARQLRVRLRLEQAERLHQRATKPETGRLQGIGLLDDALAALDLARERLPAGASEGVPRPTLEALRADLERSDELVRLKKARLYMAGGASQRKAAGELVDELLARKDLDPDVRRQAEQVREGLTERLPEWRSGS